MTRRTVTLEQHTRTDQRRVRVPERVHGTSVQRGGQCRKVASLTMWTGHAMNDQRLTTAVKAATIIYCYNNSSSSNTTTNNNNYYYYYNYNYDKLTSYS